MPMGSYSPHKGLMLLWPGGHRSVYGTISEGIGVAEQVKTWTTVGVDSPLRSGPTCVPVVPVHGVLKRLSFEARA